MNTKSKVARPLGNGAMERVNSFLGIHKPIIKEITHKNKKETITTFSISAIDETKIEDFQLLANWKLENYLKGNKYRTIETFIKHEIRIAKQIKDWFNPITEFNTYQRLQLYINFLKNVFQKEVAPPPILKPKHNDKIFTSYVGFQIFESFRNEIVAIETKYADYSYIFGVLKRDEFIHEMKHQKFIAYLKSINVTFDKKYKQFKYYKNAQTKEKTTAYSRYKKQFQQAIG